MSDPKPLVHRLSAILLLSAFFLSQCALISQFQKLRKAAALSSSQGVFVLADGTAPPPPPIKL